MRPLRTLLLLPLLLATPAAAQSSLSLTDIARQFCAARLAGDMAPVAPLLTPDLAALIAGRDDVTWQGFAGRPASCMPVGASGTYDHPQSVLAYGLADGDTASDRLVLSFIDSQLRLDDIAFGDGTSLRTHLGAAAVR